MGAQVGRPMRRSNIAKPRAVQLAHNPGLIIDLVADGQSVFDRRDIAKALHRFIDDPRVYTDVLTRALADPRLVTLAPGDEHHPSGLPRAARLATSDMIAVEARMVETAVGLPRDRGTQLRPRWSQLRLRPRRARCRQTSSPHSIMLPWREILRPS